MFALTSSVLVEQGIMPDRYTLAKGDSVSPPLSWTDPPAGTRGFALTCVDPDVPWGSFGLPPNGTEAGDLYVHWVVYNMPPSVKSLSEGASRGSLPGGAGETLNTGRYFPEETPLYQGRTGYAGCAPPPGEHAHRYIFTVYALDRDSLPLSPESSYLDVIKALAGHVLGTASLTVHFGHGYAA